MTKTQRLIRLMVSVYEKKQFTVAEMAEEYGVSYRTMLRYLDELSGMGVPLYSDVGKGGGYSLLNSKKPPSLGLRSAPLVRRVFKPSTCLVGLEMQAPFTAVFLSDAVIPALWTELASRTNEIRGAIAPERLVGAFLHRGAVFRYIAGVETDSLQDLPEGMSGISVPARAYAVYTHEGPLRREERDQTYFLALEKLRGQHTNHDPDAFHLEVYDATGGSDDNRCDIYIPLR